MGVDYYIAMGDRTEKVTGLIRKYRDSERSPSSSESPRLDDPFFWVGKSLATKPVPTFTLMMKRNVLDELDAKTNLYSLNETRGIKTIGDLRTYCVSGEVKVEDGTLYGDKP